MWLFFRGRSALHIEAASTPATLILDATGPNTLTLDPDPGSNLTLTPA